MKCTPLQERELRLLKLFLSHAEIAQIKQALDEGKKVEKVETELLDPPPEYVAIEIAPPQRGVHGKEVCRINGF
jgi:hypothetical protein